MINENNYILSKSGIALKSKKVLLSTATSWNSCFKSPAQRNCTLVSVNSMESVRKNGTAKGLFQPIHYGWSSNFSKQQVRLHLSSSLSFLAKYYSDSCFLHLFVSLHLGLTLTVCRIQSLHSANSLRISNYYPVKLFTFQPQKVVKIFWQSCLPWK